MGDSLTKKTLQAGIWSTVTEVGTRLISPVLNMILARILAPEAFGVLATVTMVISFAEIFVESGFQKFLIQHEFADEKEEHQYMSVAFWSNMLFSLVIWAVILIFRNPIASIAGNEELGIVIAVSGVMIPMYGVIGIQNCIIKKRLQFKRLFYVRVPAAAAPLIITVPLACMGLGYWSLIIGNIGGLAIQSLALLYVGRFKPLAYFSLSKLKHMLKSGAFTLMDGLAVWATNWVDMFLIANSMTEHELGLYKNSISIITALFAMVNSAVVPVLYSSLSKLQKDNEAFKRMFLAAQKLLCMFILPLGVGVYLYRDLATQLMLGDQWSGAAYIVGITALTYAARVCFVSFYSSAYQAKGYFFLPLIMQVLDLVMLVPTCIIAARSGFDGLVTARALIRLDLIIPEMIAAFVVCRIKPGDTIKAVYPYCISAGVMCILAIQLQSMAQTLLWNFASILLCAAAYFAVLFLFKKERNLALGVAKNFVAKRRTHK